MPTRTGRSDEDFAREIQAHIALETERLIGEGMSPDEARAAAHRSFGNVVGTQERFYESGRVMWLDDAPRDVRHALRALVRSPGFAAAAILTLALGIGANTAIFSVVQAVLLRSLPYTDADRFVRLVEETEPEPGSPATIRVAGVHKFELDILRSQARSLSHVGFYTPTAVTASARDQAISLSGVRLSPAILAMLGRQPLLGRLFEPREELSGLDAVVVLGYDAWQRHFGGQANIVGQVIALDGIGYSVVGVMPEGFQFPDADAQFWIPFVWPMQARLVTTARLSDGVSIQAASQEVGTILRQLRESSRFAGLGAPPPPPPPPPGLRGQAGPAAPPPLPVGDGKVRPSPGARPRPPRFRLIPLQEQMVASVKPALLVLTAAVGFVLLIACVNVGNLLLARGAARQGEMAIRVALGAGRGRLIRQVLTEGVLLSIAGGALGTVLAFGGVRLLRTLGATLPRRSLGPSFGLPRLDEVSIDTSVLLFTVTVSLVTGLVFGLMPALVPPRSDHGDLLREQTGTTRLGFSLFRRHRLRGLLVVAEVAMAMLLFLGAGLLIRSFAKLSSVDPGFEPSGVLTFQVALPPGRSAATFRDDLLARLEPLSGARDSGYADRLPMGPTRGVMQLRRSAQQPRVPPPPPAPGGNGLPEFPDLRLVSHGFMSAMGMRIVQGRGFDERDGAGQPQAMLVNRALARSGFLGANPIGTQIYGYGDVPWTIVGIVDDVRQSGLDVEPGPQIFVDFRQFPPAAARTWPWPYFAVRTDGEPAAMVSTIRALVTQLEPQATLDSVATLQQIVSNSVVRPRMYAVLLGVFAAVAVTLAVVGIYGVVSYSVAQRTREIGIRMALGAGRSDVLTLVLRQSIPLVAAGLALGIGGAAIVTRSLEGLLFGLTPRDPTTFLIASLVFGAVATFAALLPARRATTVDPLLALRAD